jgi:hypothetical protein
MLFLLDSNDVPGVLQWVMIRGDPARLCFDVSCNVVVALLGIFSLRNFSMSGKHEHWAWEVIRLYRGT